MGDRHQCLRCEGAQLDELAGAPSIQFFRCPQCRRARPTQRVRDILGLRVGVTEQDVREFLKGGADGLVTSR